MNLKINQCRTIGSCFSLHKSHGKAAENFMLLFSVGILKFFCCTSAAVRQVALCGNQITVMCVSGLYCKYSFC